MRKTLFLISAGEELCADVDRQKGKEKIVKKKIPAKFL
jgi:hypothetical protein